MVPQGWSLPNGTTSMLFNLWVNGDQAMRIRAHRFLRSFDLAATDEHGGEKFPAEMLPAERKLALWKISRTWHSYLTQATDVMIVIEHESGLKFRELAALPAAEREEKFVQAFQAMCRRLEPGMSDEKLDRERLQDKAWMTIYRRLSKKSLLRKQVVRKRNRSDSA